MYRVGEYFLGAEPILMYLLLTVSDNPTLTLAHRGVKIALVSMDGGLSQRDRFKGTITLL